MPGGRDLGWLKPPAAMVVTQVMFAGMNILYKLALNDGMDYRIVVAYRYLFAVAVVCPVAFVVERKRRTKLTLTVLLFSFLSAILGACLTQILYIASIKLTSATYASAIANLIPGEKGCRGVLRCNPFGGVKKPASDIATRSAPLRTFFLIPAITFILAILFKLEKLSLRTTYGQAKLIGTLLGLGGAMLLTFYRGPQVQLWSTHINLLSKQRHLGLGQPPPAAAAAAAAATHQVASSNRAIGSFLAIMSCFSYAAWLILQAKLTQMYPFPCTNTALMCLMGSLQTSILAAFFERGKADWILGFDIRLLTVIYSGVFSSGLAFTLLSWCIKVKGPLYASAFNPLVLVIVAFFSSLLLDEKLFLGCLLGAGLIVIGLYMVLWGKGKEASIVQQLI